MLDGSCRQLLSRHLPRVAGNELFGAIRQDSSGALSGRALLIFPEAGSLELVRLVVGKKLPLEDIIDLEDEALAETGNIILNSWVATIANLLKHGLKMSLPVVMRGHNNDIFHMASETERLVLFLHIRFVACTSPLTKRPFVRTLKRAGFQQTPLLARR